jgi:hypothetical protein
MDMPVGWTLTIINFVGFFAVLIILECLRWRILKQEDSFTKVQQAMNTAEFEAAVAEG